MGDGFSVRPEGTYQIPFGWSSQVQQQSDKPEIFDRASIKRSIFCRHPSGRGGLVDARAIHADDQDLAVSERECPPSQRARSLPDAKGGKQWYDVRWRLWAGAQRFFVSSREGATRREMRKFHKEIFVLGYEISGQLDYKLLPAVQSRGRADSARFFKFASCKTRAGLLLALQHWKEDSDELQAVDLALAHPTV